MQTAAALGLELPKPIHGYQPSTFLERGVVVPYTTPHLAGGRVRPGERAGLELIVPNLSGGRGVYVLPLEGVQALCSPTLHDRALNARIAGLRAVTPSAIRLAARDIAAEGLAGEEVATSAAMTLAAEQQLGLLAHLELLLELLRQVEPRHAGWTPPDQRDPEQLGRRARVVLASLSPQTGRSAEAMMGVLEELAQVFSAVGVGRQTPAARLSGLIRLLDDLRLQMQRWHTEPGREGATEAEIIAGTAGLTLAAARTTLHEARAALGNLPQLMQRWLTEPDTVGRLVARPEWLLDGWERIGLLWCAADEHIDRKQTLGEMAALVPTIPREASDWVGGLDMEAESKRHRRKVALGEDWRTGITVTDLVARNEKLRAMSPGGPA